MPLIQWIMQNLQPTANGVVVDGVAMVEKLMNVVAAGGATISGVSGNYVITTNDGVIIDGFAPNEAEFNSQFTGGVELNGEAFLSFESILRKIIPYSLGDKVYMDNGLEYMVLGFFWDLDAELKYEITNYNETMFVAESLLYSDRNQYYANKHFLIDSQLNNLIV